jgi:hypothetical protein
MNLDCRSSHEASRSTAVDRHSKGLYFHFRKRLCRVDAWIPGPDVSRGKGMDTHAIDLGGLRTLGTRATDLRPVRLGVRSPPRGVAVTPGLTRRSVPVHTSRGLFAAATCHNILSNVRQWLVSPPESGLLWNWSRLCRCTRLSCIHTRASRGRSVRFGSFEPRRPHVRGRAAVRLPDVGLYRRRSVERPSHRLSTSSGRGC